MAKVWIACSHDHCRILEAPEGYTLEEAEKLGILQEQKSEIVKPLDETQEADEKGILEER